MREIRPSGSEGGAGRKPRSYLYRGPGILPGASFQTTHSAKSTVLGVPRKHSPRPAGPGGVFRNANATNM